MLKQRGEKTERELSERRDVRKEKDEKTWRKVTNHGGPLFKVTTI